MGKRRSVGRGAGRKGSQHNRFNIETLEDRRLLAAVGFGTPILTALPNGFVPAGVQPVITAAPFYTVGSGGNYGFGVGGGINSDTGLLVTKTGGGGLVLGVNNDGTFTTTGTIISAYTVIGAASTETSQGNAQLIVFTTTGYMVQQPNGSFSVPAGYTLPSDVVAGGYAIGAGFPGPSGSGPARIVERFTPNSGDPTLGSIILSTYTENANNGTFGPHVDTTIATNAASPAGESFLSVGLDSSLTDLNYDGISDVVANGSVWFGNSDGSFRIGPSLGLSTAEKASTLTEGTVFVDGVASNDLVLYPAPATSADPNSDAAQVFINNGAGSFSRGPRVDLAPAGTTVGPLVVADLNNDDVPDIAALVSSGASAPAIAVAQGTALNGFLASTSLTAPANTQFVDATTSEEGLISILATTTGGTTRYSMQTIPSTSTPGPVITLSASSSSVFVGQRVVITADRSSIDQAGMQYALLDGTTDIGTATVAADGSLTFAVSSLSAGAHVLTVVSASSTGDVSAPLTLTVNADPPTGLVFATGIQPALRAVEVPGDTPTLKVSLRNIGGATATSPVAVSLFASTTTNLTSDAIPVPDAQLANLNPALGVRKDRTVSSKMTIPDNLTPGTYYLIAQIAAAKQSGANQVIGGTIVDFSSFQVAWQFGHVGTRSNVKFVQHLSGGSVVTFSMTGNGYGVVTPGTGPLTLGNGNPNYQVNIAQTNLKSRLTISQTGSTKSNIVGLAFNSDVGTVDVHTDTPHLIEPGPVDDNGNALGTDIYSIKQLTIGTVPTATLTGTAPSNTSTVGDINVNGFLGQLNASTIDDSTVEVGADASGAVQMDIGTLGQTASISSSVPISKLNLGTALAGSSIAAPSVGALVSNSNFSSSMVLSGSTHGAVILGSVKIGGSVSAGRWAVNGNIGDIQIRGSVANLQLLAGARLGPMGELTSPPAAYSGVSIKSLTINGSVTSSLLSAGLDPLDGILLDGQLLPGGSFGSITIGSTLNQDSKIVASSLPATATIGRQKVPTASDTRFKLISPS